MSEKDYHLNIEQIQRYLPHKSPFLFVDRILEISPTGDLDDMTSNHKVGTRVVGIKNFTYNEPFMPGHFPGMAIVPGVILLETIGQVASFSLYPYIGRDLENFGKKFQIILVGIDQARFRRPVVPGDTLRVETVVSKARGKLWVFECRGTVDGHVVVEAELLANLLTSAEIGIGGTA